ncbi:unnamed protein product [Owenia fusiformis]|uniref:Uncharacterized protein n=1 Tax=Owenia fusiformis TaxID=6347 RepID=A0A8J1XTW4_OWEFU|nr:unnamed protein product [Owenia fusiformis]
MEQEGKSASVLKETGNTCMRDGKFIEAILHYSQALKLEPINPLLHSNRSLAFLKCQQYYLALGDAEKCIHLNPKWPKGYFRKGEVLYQTEKYEDAVEAYKTALDLQPEDANLKERVMKSMKEVNNIRKADRNLPWVGSGTGFLLGLFIIVGDDYIAQRPTISSDILRILLIAVFIGLGYGCARVYRYLRDSQKESLLEPPLDLLKEMGPGRGLNRDKDGNPIIQPGVERPPPWDPASTTPKASSKNNTKQRKKKK